MNYHLSVADPNSKFLDISLRLKAPPKNQLQLVLPAWRPGRYELANFAQYIREWKVTDEEGQPLSWAKTDKNTWNIEVGTANEIIVKYRYFGHTLDAGSTYVNEEQLYVNPVNCLLYQQDALDQECLLEIEHPGQQIAIGWPPKEAGTRSYLFPDFHHLVDTPFIVSDNLQKINWTVEGIQMFLWFQGECRPEVERLKKDFNAFTKKQLAVFGDFPATEFHFLFQIKPVRAYHGVEHLRSTVILLGPGYDLFSKSQYPELLGVSSHELFHCWNVKTIRPAEMMPYNYHHENHSPLGYVAEGVTTYYGDQILLRAGLLDQPAFFDILARHVQRHQDNFARFHSSVAESSHDTWLDGYKAGVPHRRLSIYSDGALLAFMADVRILQATGGKASLDEVMRRLYKEYGQKGKGFTESDYQTLLEEVGHQDFGTYFFELVNGHKGYWDDLNQGLEALGLECNWSHTDAYGEGHLGLKTNEEGTVLLLYPDSVAEKAGLRHKDKVLSVNGMVIQKNLHQWLAYFGQEKEIRLIVERDGQLKKIQLHPKEGVAYFQKASIELKKEPSPEQKALFDFWLKR